MGHFFDQLWIQNTIVLGGFTAVLLLLRAGFRSERWARAWARFRRDRVGVFAGGLISVYLLLGGMEMIQVPQPGGFRVSLVSWLARGIAQEKSYSAPLAARALSVSDPVPLRSMHLFGTDALGKDTLIQTIRACRTALVIGGLTSAIYLPLGAILGILAGYYRRWVDDLITYIYSTLASIPEILLLVSILMVLGKGLGTMAVALGVTGWVGICRLIRGETLRQAERPYVAAARAMGLSHWRIMATHILPNVLHLILINFVLGFSGLVLAEAILSYLGVGSPVGTPSWGAMIDGARGELSRDPVVWWNLVAATGALFGLVLSLNVFGDALRRAFDPKHA
jgi:peptide/nickel transport system permease protein